MAYYFPCCLTIQAWTSLKKSRSQNITHPRIFHLDNSGPVLFPGVFLIFPYIQSAITQETFFGTPATNYKNLNPNLVSMIYYVEMQRRNNAVR